MESWNLVDYGIFTSSMLTRLAVEFVIIFFVLSGFSIGHSISKSQNTAKFYKKRLLRIYPPYLFALVWAGVVYLITYQLHPEFYSNIYHTPTFERYARMNYFFELENIIKNIFYLPMKGFIVQFWSLTYEIIFYILAPILFLKKRIYYYISAIFFSIYLVFGESYHILHFDSILLKYFFLYNFFFAIGWYLYYNFETILSFLHKMNRTTYVVVILFLLLSTYAINIYLQSETVWSYIPSGLLSVVLILYFLKYRIRIKPLMVLGRYSYTLYITHVASIFLYHSIYYTLFPNVNPPYIFNFLVFIPAIFFSIGVAYIQYEIVEKKTKNLLNKMRKN